MSLNIVNSFKLAPPPPGIVGGWVELGRTTLGSPNSTISVTGLADKRYLMYLFNDFRTAGNTDGKFRLNNDASNAYSRRESQNGAADVTSINSDRMGYNVDTGADVNFTAGYLANFATSEKLAQYWRVNRNSAGAGSAPNRREWIGKHAQTVQPISSLQLNTGGSDTYSTGSQMVVLGWDPADTHTDNFWEELASTTLGSPANDITVSFTSKKYMWFQLGTIPVTSGMNSNLRLGSSSTLDTGSNYAFRGSANGGADATATSSTSLDTFNGDQTVGNLSYCNGFFINNAANEKLIIYRSALIGTAGAGTAPARRENVGKWANTSNQADILGFVRIGGTGQHGIGSTLKVWGSN